MADWESHLHILPSHMRDGLRIYLENGIEPGGFLTAVLCNDLKNAALKADDVNSRYLKTWAEYMVWYMPAIAQGSVEKVEEWIRHRGFSGLAEFNAANQAVNEQDNAAEEF